MDRVMCHVAAAGPWYGHVCGGECRAHCRSIVAVGVAPCAVTVAMVVVSVGNVGAWPWGQYVGARKGAGGMSAFSRV